MPIAYARNRAIYLIEALRHRRAFAPLPRPWRPPTQAAAPCEHPEVSGLWVLRNALSAGDVADVRALVEHALPTTQRSGGTHAALVAAEREVATLRKRYEACEDPSLRFPLAEQLRPAISARDAFRIEAERAGPPVPPRRSGTQWEWYEYEPGRRLAPVLVEEESAASALELGLEEFEVFDKSHPREWLSLQRLLGHGDERVRRGARALRRHTHGLVGRLPGALSPRAKCRFLQLQMLQRGASITPHIDAPTPPADVVATLTLAGDSSVVVGSAVVELQVGDVYAIAGPARWDYEHAVRPSFGDRLTLTLRYSDPPQQATAAKQPAGLGLGHTDCCDARVIRPP